MSDAHNDGNHTESAMDYPEHENTYDMFLKVTKYGTIFCVALLVAMAFGFFVSGWFGGILSFIVLFAIGMIMS